MSKKCPDCGSLNVEEVFDGEAYCKNCYLHCSVFDLEDASVFDQITASPEVLAEKLVYRYDGNGTWRSFLLYGYEFLTKAEAVATTVEKLKEVGK